MYIDTTVFILIVYILPVHMKCAGVVTDVYPSHVIHSHEITCCGVGFSPSGKSIGSGDLAGNVWVTESTKVAPIYKYTVSIGTVVL